MDYRHSQPAFWLGSPMGLEPGPEYASSRPPMLEYPYPSPVYSDLELSLSGGESYGGEHDSCGKARRRKRKGNGQQVRAGWLLLMLDIRLKI